MAGILFDVDGTLIDSVDAHTRAWVDALRDFGYEVSFDEMRSLIGMGGDKILPRIDPALRSGEGTGKAISDRRKSILLERELSKIRATPGAADLLRAVKERGIRAVLATSAQPDELEALLAQTGLSDLVDRAASAEDAKNSKPDPDVVHAALANAHLDAAHAAFVGDTRYDIEAAHKAGLPAIAVRCGGMDPETLGEAEAIYDDPAGILRSFDASPLAKLTG